MLINTFVLISVLFCLYIFTWGLCDRFDFIVDNSVLLRRVNYNFVKILLLLLITNSVHNLESEVLVSLVFYSK